MNAKWQTPQSVTDMEIVFGPSKKELREYLPPWEEIPEEFKRETKEVKKWINCVNDIFYKGIVGTNIRAKKGIDGGAAIRQCSMILHSFEPKHEHKTAGVAYLLSLWFEDFQYVVNEE